MRPPSPAIPAGALRYAGAPRPSLLPTTKQRAPINPGFSFCLDEKRGSRHRFDRGKIGAGHIGFDLAVERVARLQRDLFAFADLRDRGDVGMVAVVADLGLFGQGLAPIDADPTHGPTSRLSANPQPR